MNTSDSTMGSQPDKPDSGGPEQNFEHLKEHVTEALGGARQQADAQFGQYRDTAADQIEALVKGAKSKGRPALHPIRLQIFLEVWECHEWVV